MVQFVTTYFQQKSIQLQKVIKNREFYSILL